VSCEGDRRCAKHRGPARHGWCPQASGIADSDGGGIRRTFLRKGGGDYLAMAVRFPTSPDAPLAARLFHGSAHAIAAS
jgi:hypothetical protein